jgi:hypothetical protein
MNYNSLELEMIFKRSHFMQLLESENKTQENFKI